MDRKTFAYLLKKYLDGQASEQERLTVEHWYALLDVSPEPEQLRDWDELESKLWATLEFKAGLSPIKTKRRGGNYFRKYLPYLAAASITLLIVAGYVFWSRQTDSDLYLHGYTIVVNREAKVKNLLLEDGSIVSLSPKASLRYPKIFDKEFREVSLEGEAFFKVSENPERPFFVNAGKITTKVLGTSFNINAPFKDSDVVVSVRTGKVSVYEKEKPNLMHSSKANNGVILKPNHQATFMVDRSVFITQLVAEPQPVIAQVPGQFQFDDKPLIEVIQLLERTYAIDITLDRKIMGACPLTANLYQKGLYAQLDLICAAIQGKYELKGTAILVSGRGCD